VQTISVNIKADPRPKGLSDRILVLWVRDCKFTTQDEVGGQAGVGMRRIMSVSARTGSAGRLCSAVLGDGGAHGPSVQVKTCWKPQDLTSLSASAVDLCAIVQPVWRRGPGRDGDGRARYYLWTPWRRTKL
jgi:hypothetical protein